MIKPTALVLLLLMAVPASAQPHPLRWIRTHKLQIVADALMVGSAALDVASTRSALAEGNHEGNPIYGARPGLGRLLAIKAAFILPIAAGNNFLDRHSRGGSRRSRAEILIPSLILSIPEIWAAHHNWKLGPVR
jgi:hypothetical protein